MTDQTPILNWIPRFDERSRDFPVRAAIPTIPVLKNKLWRTGPILDQGREGACVGFGWTAEALSTPIPVNLSRMKIKVATEPNSFARTIYQRAKTIDEWAGENYEGTSVLAGAKVLKELNLIKEYRWAFSINDVIDSVITKGPVVLGIYWYSGMYSAPNGVLNVSGSIVGGHCITVVGYRLGKYTKTGVDSVILQNSWGNDWGINGLAEMKVTQLDMLLRNDGEACVPTRRSYGR